MSARTWFIRCGDCHEDFVAVTNLLNGKPLWTAPKRKRGGCQHDPLNAEVFAGEQGWIRQDVAIDELAADQRTEAAVAKVRQILTDGGDPARIVEDVRHALAGAA